MTLQNFEINDFRIGQLAQQALECRRLSFHEASALLLRLIPRGIGGPRR